MPIGRNLSDATRYMWQKQQVLASDQQTTTDLTIDFEYNPTRGALTCLVCSKLWCTHLQNLIDTRGDAQSIWDHEANSYNLDSMTILLPMFPIHNFWSIVSLTRVQVSGTQRYGVEWEEPPNSGIVTNPPPVRLDPVFIGYISPGEGRKIIRSLLVEYMWSDPNRQKECSAAHHGVAAQKDWERRTTYKPTPSASRIASYWSVYTKGQCIYCLEHDGSTNTDDLVPEKSRNIWPS